jgi:hypothetical protein
MTTHILDVSLEGLVRTLPHQFTSSTTFLSELLQNARRAGASAIHIEWDHYRAAMTIRDDGCGITDYGPLFKIHQSGWNASTLAKENPFGVGFMAAVAASEHILIRSLDQRCEFHTRSLLLLEPIKVVPSPDPNFKGTELTLRLRSDVAYPTRSGPSTDEQTTHYWKHTLERIVSGFPTPVHFQGKLLPRPHALDTGLKFLTTEIGQVHLHDWKECNPPHPNSRPHLYYQGLPVALAHRRATELHDIIHLDNATFQPRLPDRDTLIDSDLAEERIQNALTMIWRRRLIDLHGGMPAEHFVERYWQLCVTLKLPDLLRDAPVARSMLGRYEGPLSLIGERDDLAPWDRPLPEPNAIFIDPVDQEYCGADDDVAAPLASVYAMQRALPVLDDRVPSCHWSRHRTLDLANSELGVHFTLQGETRKGRFQGEWIDCDVLVCESYTIAFAPTPLCEAPAELRAILTPVTVHDVAFYDPGTNCAVIPAGCKDCSQVIAQISDFEDSGDRFREDEFGRDQQAIQQLADSLRSNSSAHYLQLLMSSLRLDAALLQDRTFRVRYQGGTGTWEVSDSQ